jgi:hypothetical protein
MKSIEQILKELEVPAITSGAPQTIFKEMGLIIQKLEERVSRLERGERPKGQIDELED